MAQWPERPCVWRFLGAQGQDSPFSKSGAQTALRNQANVVLCAGELKSWAQKGEEMPRALGVRLRMSRTLGVGSRMSRAAGITRKSRGEGLPTYFRVGPRIRSRAQNEAVLRDAEEDSTTRGLFLGGRRRESKAKTIPCQPIKCVAKVSKTPVTLTKKESRQLLSQVFLSLAGSLMTTRRGPGKLGSSPAWQTIWDSVEMTFASRQRFLSVCHYRWFSPRTSY